MKKKFSSNKKTTAEILKELFGSFVSGEEFYGRLGIVKSINDSEKTASVQIIDGDLLDDVRLQQVASDGGLFIKPAVDSAIIIGWTDKTTAFISMHSQIDEIIFQGGTFGGLIKITELTTKLNDLATNINTNYGLIQTAIAGVGGAYTPQNASNFEEADYENEKFKH